MAEQPTLFEVEKPPAVPKNNGMAGIPGTGPKGERCGTCRFATTGHYLGITAKRYWKCRLCRGSWTHGAASDIKLKWPACSFWRSVEPETEQERLAEAVCAGEVPLDVYADFLEDVGDPLAARVRLLDQPPERTDENRAGWWKIDCPQTFLTYVQGTATDAIAAAAHRLAEAPS